jgi:TRAP-type uncharacterized transport system substrate-binding protein
MKKHLKENILTIINEQDTHIISISKFSGERLDLGKPETTQQFSSVVLVTQHTQNPYATSMSSAIS